MKGASFRTLATAAAVCSSLVSAPSFAVPAATGARALPAPGYLIRVADDDDRDIIRLLPPGGGGGQSPDTHGPSTPDVPFPPNGGGSVPGRGLRLSGQSIKVPLSFQAWPGNETQAYAGFRLDNVTDPALADALGLSGDKGVFVVDTTPGAPAARAGLRFGDFLTAFDDAAVTQTDELVNAIKQRAPGSQGTFTVWRVGEDGTAYLQSLRQLADQGSTPAMMFLARLYTNGTGVQRDLTESVSWLRKAALAGSTNGMLLYGDALATGQGTVKDLSEAFNWISQSAKAGNVAGLLRLGRMYRDGEGVSRDPLEAVNLFKQAAEKNHPPAMVAVGLMFEGGSGLEADYFQAVQWYKRAADAGDAEGMAALGTMYSTGRGVEKNNATAASWYIEASKRGQLLAIHNLAYHYDKGLGVTRDSAHAAALVYLALERRYQFSYQQMMQNSRAYSREFRKAFQQLLANGGYYSGNINGTFGRTTFDAINTMVGAK